MLSFVKTISGSILSSQSLLFHQFTNDCFFLSSIKLNDNNITTTKKFS